MTQVTQQTTGASVATAGLGAANMVGLLLYVMHKFGVDDMPPEVASSIIGLAFAAGGYLQHIMTMRSIKHAQSGQTRAGDTDPNILRERAAT